MKETKQGNTITLMDEVRGVGIQFTEGETLQRYTAALVMADTDRLNTPEGVEEVSRIQAELIEEAAKRHHKEFAEMQ